MSGGLCHLAAAAGETQVVNLEIAPGLQVVGRVMDVDGGNVAGAEIWIATALGGWTSGEVAAITDGAGE